MKSVVLLLGAVSALALSAPAAAKAGDPVPIADGVTLDLTLDGRLDPGHGPHRSGPQPHVRWSGVPTATR